MILNMGHPPKMSVMINLDNLFVASQIQIFIQKTKYKDKNSFSGINKEFKGIVHLNIIFSYMKFNQI